MHSRHAAFLFLSSRVCVVGCHTGSAVKEHGSRVQRRLLPGLDKHTTARRILSLSFYPWLTIAWRSLSSRPKPKRRPVVMRHSTRCTNTKKPKHKLQEMPINSSTLKNAGIARRRYKDSAPEREGSIGYGYVGVVVLLEWPVSRQLPSNAPSRVGCPGVP